MLDFLIFLGLFFAVVGIVVLLVLKADGKNKP